jgi:enoyl-CoA hydratase/carnithine racemase
MRPMLMPSHITTKSSPSRSPAITVGRSASWSGGADHCVTRTLAQERAEKPPLAVSGALRCILGANEKSLDEGLRDERKAFLRCAVSKDQAEGARAFFEKRKPVFTGT